MLDTAWVGQAEARGDLGASIWPAARTRGKHHLTIVICGDRYSALHATTDRNGRHEGPD